MSEPAAAEARVFERILCGVDDSDASVTAVRQAQRLREPDGTLLLIAVAEVAKASHAGFAAGHAAGQEQAGAESALAAARELAPKAESRLAHGPPVDVLLRDAESERATLISVGSHERRRAAAMVLGTVAARMLRDAPCSVLIARAAKEPRAWPQAIVAGIDGSAESAAALAVARSVAERFGADLRAIASTKDGLDQERARELAPELEEESDRAVPALAAAAQSADLVVVGSRGLHGLKALGSVSERVANQAPCSVLVVRG
jgi:nucleotide-binding universal stress UspA family protein